MTIEAAAVVRFRDFSDVVRYVRNLRSSDVPGARRLAAIRTLMDVCVTRVMSITAAKTAVRTVANETMQPMQSP
jgi:hypothetical protein